MTRPARSLPALFGTTVLSVGVLTLTWLAVGSGGAERPEPTVPAELAFVPPDCDAVLTINLGEIWKTKVGKEALAALSKSDASYGRQFRNEWGVEPGKVQRLTFLHARLGVGATFDAEPLILLTTDGTVSADALLSTLKARPTARNEDEEVMRFGPARPLGPPASNRDAPKPRSRPEPRPVASRRAEAFPPFYETRPTSGFPNTVFVVDDRTVMFTPAFGSSGNTSALLGRLLRRRTDGPRSAALRSAEEHHFVLDLTFPPITAKMVEDTPDYLRPLLECRECRLVADLGDELTGELTATFPDADAARKAEEAFEPLLVVFDNAAKIVGGVAGKKGDPFKATVKFLDSFRVGLREIKAKVDGTRLKANVRLPAGIASLGLAAAEESKKQAPKPVFVPIEP